MIHISDTAPPRSPILSHVEGFDDLEEVAGVDILSDDEETMAVSTK